MKVIHLSILFFSILFSCLAFSAFSREPSVGDWHLATESSSFVVKSDLNGDGIIDEAVLLTDGRQIKLVAFLDKPDRLTVIDLFTILCDPASCAIGLIPPGEYRTACGKGWFECEPSDPQVMRTSRPILALGREDMVLAFLYEGNGFHQIWLTPPRRSPFAD
jgi:hypothetical protein